MKLAIHCIVLLFVVMFSTGCSNSKHYYIGSFKDRPYKNPNDITILEGDDIPDHAVIGRVHVHSIAPTWMPCLKLTKEQMLEVLKKEASNLNASAIIRVKRFSRSQFEWEEEHLMGTAVIFLDKGDCVE